MSPATHKLHLTFLRLIKGCVAAYEEWVSSESGVPVPRGGGDWVRQAEVIAAAQTITAAFKARQERDAQAAQPAAIS